MSVRHGDRPGSHTRDLTSPCRRSIGWNAAAAVAVRMSATRSAIDPTRRRTARRVPTIWQPCHKLAAVGRFDGKRALVLGVANKRSIAWAIARRLAAEGAELAFTFQGERIEANVRELASSVDSKLVTPCYVRADEDIERVFKETADAWDGKLDLLVHSVAFAAAEDLEGRFTDTPQDRFWMAVDISAYSLVPPRGPPSLDDRGRRRLDRDDDLSRRERAVPHYNVMGVAKATLDASVKYLAWDLGEKEIRGMQSRPGPCAPSRPVPSRGSRRWSRCSSSERLYAATSTPTTSRRPPPTCFRTKPRTSPGRRCTSTRGTTRWACRRPPEVNAFTARATTRPKSASATVDWTIIAYFPRKGERHHIGRAECRRIREAEMEVVRKDRSPTPRCEPGLTCCVNAKSRYRPLSLRARDRSAAVDQPVQERERQSCCQSRRGLPPRGACRATRSPPRRRSGGRSGTLSPTAPPTSSRPTRTSSKRTRPLPGAGRNRSGRRRSSPTSNNSSIIGSIHGTPTSTSPR